MDYGTMCSHYLEKEDTPCMSYEQREFYGVPMKSDLKPYKKVVNNGYTIMTSDESLIRDLEWNEKYHNGFIDWFLFRVGKTILFSTNGKVYGCTGFAHGWYVQLCEITDTEFLENE